jgi:hypothetical protein
MSNKERNNMRPIEVLNNTLNRVIEEKKSIDKEIEYYKEHLKALDLKSIEKRHEMFNLDEAIQKLKGE